MIRHVWDFFAAGLLEILDSQLVTSVIANDGSYSKNSCNMMFSSKYEPQPSVYELPGTFGIKNMVNC